MKILYHIPSTHTITAGRVYLEGYKNAFVDLGHTFKLLTSDSDQEECLINYKPDIIITSLNDYLLKYLDIQLLKKSKKNGAKVFVNTPFWLSPFSKLRITEAQSLKNRTDHINLIKSGDYGDLYYNIGEQGDPRMKGFEKKTGFKHHTLPLAADKTFFEEKFTHKYEADISFIGTYLPGRREFMKKQVFPLRKKYNVKLYCQDMTLIDRSLNFAQKVGQYFNVPLLKSFKKNNVTFEQERQIFSSSTISLNIHEDYQREFGMDCNDRTFKVPLYGGFEIVDNVACIKNYFDTKTELVVAENSKDWFDKIEYYIKNPEKRLKIIEAGRKRVLKDHTYHNRVKTMIKWYEKLK